MAVRTRSESFPWHESVGRVRRFLDEGPATWSRQARAFVRDAGDPGERLHPPLALLPAEDLEGPTLRGWLEDFPEELGLECLLLVQAGASALGMWIDDELVRHKVIKKYVVRAKGRAQTLHLKTRGKSRYGSRLRLQNARAQLEDTNEKLGEWVDELGDPERIVVSCPVRTWPELFAVDPPPPFEKNDPRLRRAGLDVRIPSFEELLRVRGLLYRGRHVAGAEL